MFFRTWKKMQNSIVNLKYGKTYRLILTSLFTVLIIMGSFIKIPIGEVPITLQLTFVILSGFILGNLYGPLSVLLYIFMGLIGLPIFSNGGGINYIFKPSFGYLIGMVFTSYIVGKLKTTLSYDFKNNENIIIKNIIIALIGMITCYIFGLTYMYLILKFYLGKTVLLSKIIYTGALVFIPKDILLCFFSGLLIYKLENLKGIKRYFL